MKRLFNNTFINKTMKLLAIGSLISATAAFSSLASAETKFHFDAGSKAQKHVNKTYQKKNKKHKKHYNTYNNRHHNYWYNSYPYYNSHSHNHNGVSVSFGGSINSRTALSIAAFALVVGGADFYFDDGHYYRHTHGRYHRVHAPIGARIHHLPRGYSRVQVGHHHYYTYRDTYYTWDRHNRCYTVVASPYASSHASNHSHNHSHNYDSHSSNHSHREHDNHANKHHSHDKHENNNSSNNSYHYQKDEKKHEKHEKKKERQSHASTVSEKRYDCHVWAVQESGYEPGKSGYSVYKSKQYTNAQNACLSKNGLATR